MGRIPLQNAIGGFGFLDRLNRKGIVENIHVVAVVLGVIISGGVAFVGMLLTPMKERIHTLREDVDSIYATQATLRERITYLEAKINGHSR